MISSLFVFMFFSACGTAKEPMPLFQEIPSQDGEEARYVLLTHSETTESTTHQLACLFQQELEEISAGRFRVSIYPNNTLGNLEDGVHAFSSGAVEFRMGSGPSDLLQMVKWAPVLSDISIEEVNDMFQEKGDFWEAVQNECQLEQSQLLTIFPAEYRVLTSNRSVESCADLNGLRLRVPELGYDRQFWSGLGASPYTAPIEAVYFELQQGQYEGQENTLSSIYSNRFYEYQDYLIETNHKIYFDSLYVSLPFYQNLGDEERVWIDTASQRVYRHACGLSETQQTQYWEDMKYEGIRQLEFPLEEQLVMREISVEGLTNSLKENYGAEKVAFLLSCLSQAGGN